MMDPLIQKYLKEKYGENYEADAKQKYEDAEFTNRMAAGVSNIGDAIAGRKIGSQQAHFDAMTEQARENTLGKIDKDRKSFMENTAFENEQVKTKKDKDLSDPNSAASIAFRKSIEATTPNFAKTYGDMWNQVSAADQELIFKPLQLNEQIKAREQAARIAAQASKDAREERADAKKSAADLKREEKELSLAVPGYERTGEVMPKAEEAMKLRKATANAEQLVSKLDRLKTLVNDKGSFEYGGTAGTEMESLATEIQLLSKGEDMYQLGVLTGPDLTLLQKITADPASMSSLFTRDSTRTSQIDTQLKSIQDKLASVTKASGYRPVAKQKSPEDPQIKQYAEAHGLTYEKAQNIINQRKAKSQIAGSGQ